MVKSEAGNSAEGTPAGVKGATSLSDGSQCQPKKRTGLMRRIFSIFLRLVIWYMVLTAAFRCPSNISDLDSTSSRVCKPYLIGRSYLEPHIFPYYEAYGAPYVDTVRPYVETFHQQVYTPITLFSKDSYQTYAAPRVEEALQATYDKWDAVVVPKLQSIQTQCLDRFDETIKPHYNYIESLVVPQYQTVTAHAVAIRDGYIMPSYTRLKPILERSYIKFHEFSTKTIIPYTCKAWSSTITFITGTLRTQITTLYTENVEPQLVRIGEKLASYREARTLSPTGEENGSVIDTLEPITTASQISEVTEATATSSSTTTPPSSTISEMPSETHTEPPKPAEIAREKIIADLRSWQERFAIAADTGCQDLEEQITELVQRVLDEGSDAVGEDLVSQLETVADYELGHLKQTINDIVSSMPDLPTLEEEEVARAEIIKSLKYAGLAIRDAAHSLRKWFNNYDEKLVSEVDSAISTTLSVLDSIRDLGLQEIGMRWAWMDGVTYKDWAKFHSLKQRFSEWRDEVRDIGTQNTALLGARSNANDIVTRGMDIAEKAAKELSALREIAELKIQAGDSSDNFDMELIDPEVIVTRRKLIEERQAATEPPSEGVVNRSAAYDLENENIGDAGLADDQFTGTSGEAQFETPPDFNDYNILQSDSTSTTAFAEPSRSTSMGTTAQQQNVETDTSKNKAEKSCEECVEESTESNSDMFSEFFSMPAEEARSGFAEAGDSSVQQFVGESGEDMEATASQPPTVLVSTETAQSVGEPIANLDSDLSKVSESYSNALNEASNANSGDVRMTLEEIERRRDEAIALALEQYSSAIKLAVHTPSASAPIPDSEDSSHTVPSTASPTDTVTQEFETTVYSVDEDDSHLDHAKEAEADPFEFELVDETISDIESDELISDDTVYSEEDSSDAPTLDDLFDNAHETFPTASGDEDGENESYTADEEAEEYPTEEFKNEL